MISSSLVVINWKENYVQIEAKKTLEALFPSPHSRQS